MSTKSKKLYSKLDIIEASKNHYEVQKCYARKSKRRRTLQIRIGIKWHERIKEIAKSDNMLMSFILDSICKKFFENYQ